MWEKGSFKTDALVVFVCFSSLVLILTPEARGAAFCLVNQDRSVTANVGELDGETQSISDSASDAGVFDVSYTISNDGAQAQVNQLSSIQSDLLSAYLGGMGYGGYPFYGGGNSKYEIIFSLDESILVEVKGTLTGGGYSGSAWTTLVDSNEEEFFGYATKSMLYFDESYSLSPGQYTFTVCAGGGSDLYSGTSGSGYANVQLQIIPEPCSFAFFLVGGWIGLRFRG